MCQLTGTVRKYGFWSGPPAHLAQKDNEPCQRPACLGVPLKTGTLCVSVSLMPGGSWPLYENLPIIDLHVPLAAPPLLPRGTSSASIHKSRLMWWPTRPLVESRRTRLNWASATEPIMAAAIKTVTWLMRQLKVRYSNSPAPSGHSRSDPVPSYILPRKSESQSICRVVLGFL